MIKSKITLALACICLTCPSFAAAPQLPLPLHISWGGENVMKSSC